MENRGSDVSNGAQSGRRAAERTKPAGAANLAARAWRPEDLSFCGDVYPVEVLDDVACVVGTTLQDVRAARALEHMASGLWLSTEAARALDAFAARTGRLIRICLEPELGAVLERADQTAAFFSGWLLPAADALGVPREIVHRHLGICFDVCHHAVMFEEPADALGRLLDAGVPVGKIQLSSALEAPGADAKTVLASYAEPRYLHQVRLRLGERLHGVPDLDQAFTADLPRDPPWRVRFHVPVHRAQLAQGLAGTQSELLGVLDFLAGRPDFRPQLEVETDTWRALPENERPSPE